MAAVQPRARSRVARFRSASVALIVTLLAFAAPNVANAATTIVRPNAMAGWLLDDQDLNAVNGAPVGRFDGGPGLPPTGYGSFRQQALTGDKQALITPLHNGASLSGITTLAFSTYSTDDNDATVITTVLKLHVDKDGDGDADTTLVYEPYEQALYGTGPSTVAHTWQTWSTVAGSWWSTQDGGVGAIGRKSLADWNTAFGPKAAIARLNPGGIRIEAGSSGSSWPNFIGNVDTLVVNDTTYDFEPLAVHPDGMQGWSFEHQNLNTANAAPSASFVNGPSTPASGYGSLSLSALQGDKAAVITTSHNGASLASIGALTYSTYISPSTPLYPAAMKLSVDKDGDGAQDTTLVYEPSEQVGYGTGAAPAANTWQTWDALAGRWWSTAATDGGNAGPRLPLSVWNAQFGGAARISVLTPAGVRIEAGATGTSWGDHVGSIDDVAVGLSAYDFETLKPSTPSISTPTNNAALNNAIVTVSGTTSPYASIAVRKGATTVLTTTASALGAWSASHNFGAGSHTINAIATDRFGNTSSASPNRSFVIDLTAPNAPIISSPQAGAILTSASVRFAGTAEPNSQLAVKKGTSTLATTTANNVGTWSVSSTLPDGSHTVYAVATDAAGNQSAQSANRTFSINLSAPMVPVIATPGSHAAVNTASVNVSGTASPSVSVRVYEGATEIGSTTSDGAGAWSVPIAFLDGTHNIHAVSDNGTYTSAQSAVRTFKVDTVAPAIPTITAPVANAKFATKNVTVTGTGEPAAIIVLKRDGVTVASREISWQGTWSADLSLADGSHTITAAVKDAASNLSAPASVSFSIDTVKPTVAISTSNGSVFQSGQQVEIAGVAGDTGGLDHVKVRFFNAATGALVATTDATLTPSGTGYTWVAVQPTLPTNAYTTRATATDTHGNTASASITIVKID